MASQQPLPPPPFVKDQGPFDRWTRLLWARTSGAQAEGISAFLATPTSANLAAAVTDETGTGALVFATSPTIVGGTHTALTGLGIRSTGTGAFDLTLANTENLTAGRTLTLTLNDAARTVNLAGNLTVSKSMSFTAADDTGVYTFPTGTASIARTDAAQTFAGVQTFSGYIAASVGIGGPASSSIGLYVLPSALTGTTQYGSFTYLTANSAATVAAIGHGVTAYVGGAFTLPLAIGMRIQPIVPTGGAVVTQGVGLLILNQSIATGVVASRAIELQNASATGKWNIYSSGTADNLLYGNTRIGASVVAPTVALDVTGAALISNTLGVTGASTLPTIYGSSAANGDITIEGTSHATKTTSYVLLQPTGGNVVIGTSAPKTHPTSAKISNLAVEAVNSYTAQSLMAYSSLATSGGILVLAKSRGTSLGTLTETQANDYLGFISAEGVNSSSALAMAGYLTFAQDGAAGATYIGGMYRLFLGTSSAAPTERFRINSSGYAGIASGARLQLDGVALTGDTYIVESSANVLDLYAGGSNSIKCTGAAVTVPGTLGVTGVSAFGGATSSASTAAIFPAGTTAISSLRIPHGAAPTTPVDGDVWSTTTTLNFRLNGVTKSITMT